MQPETTGVRTWQWVVTVIVIILLVVLGYYMIKGGDSKTPDIDDTNSDTTLQTSKDINRVVITDQFPGNIVYLSSVQLANPGFVVVHKDNAGKPGDVIGSQYFEKGINPGKITLTSSTMEGGIYYAALYADTDGDKKFTAGKDLPLKNASNQNILMLFRATTNIVESKG